MLISIIIPVYNSEKYLRECLDSIIVQTFRDYEVLLVNDGSKDRSGDICEEYAQKDMRFKLFHKENGGVSAARNLGLQKAQGQWIVFVDSDDIVSGNYLDVFKEKILDDVDFILLNIDRFANGIQTPLVQFSNFNKSRDNFMREFALYPHFPGPCGKFFKLQIIRENSIFYDSKLTFGEDALFNLIYLRYVGKIISYNKGKYLYRDTCNSLSKKHCYENDGYLFSQLDQVLTTSYSNEYYGRNVHYAAHRYFFSILNADITSSKKTMLLRNLLSEKRELVLKVLKGQRIHGIPLTAFIKLGLLKTMVTFFDLLNISTTHRHNK